MVVLIRNFIVFSHPVLVAVQFIGEHQGGYSISSTGPSGI